MVKCSPGDKNCVNKFSSVGTYGKSSELCLLNYFSLIFVKHALIKVYCNILHEIMFPIV